MSIDVAPDALAAAVGRCAITYLLTPGQRERPHVRAVRATAAAGVVHVSEAGRTSTHDIAVNDAVTLLGPPAEPGGHTLIVDGSARVVGDRIEIVPVRAVLHRAAPAVEPGPCASDCAELPARITTA